MNNFFLLLNSDIHNVLDDVVGVHVVAGVRGSVVHDVVDNHFIDVRFAVPLFSKQTIRQVFALHEVLLF